MRNILSKTDNVGDTLAAAAFNANLRSELQIIATSAGFTLDPEAGPDTNLKMLVQALGGYIGAGRTYADSGAANAYVLTLVGTLEPIDKYYSGLEIIFPPGNVNTGASTVNVETIGVKSLTLQGGAALSGDELPAGKLCKFIFNLAGDRFELSNVPVFNVEHNDDGTHGDITATTLDVTGQTLTGSIGVGKTPDVKFQAVLGDGVDPTYLAGTVGVFQNNDDGADNCNVTIIGGATTGQSRLFFGDDNSDRQGQITYDHQIDRLNFVTNTATNGHIDVNGEWFFPNISTTASAANAFINSGSTPVNQLLRSTSSAIYKTAISDLTDSEVDYIINNTRSIKYKSLGAFDDPDAEHFGITAEEAVEVDVRLINLGYQDGSFEEIEEEVTVQAFEEVEIQKPVYTVENGKAVRSYKPVIKKKPLFEAFPIIKEDGSPVLKEDGTQAYYINPIMATEPEKVKKRVLKDDAVKVPDSVQYERYVPILLNKVKRLSENLAESELKNSALIALILTKGIITQEEVNEL